MNEVQIATRHRITLERALRYDKKLPPGTAAWHFLMSVQAVVQARSVWRAKDCDASIFLKSSRS